MFNQKHNFVLIDDVHLQEPGGSFYSYTHTWTKVVWWQMWKIKCSWPKDDEREWRSCVLCECMRIFRVPVSCKLRTRTTNTCRLSVVVLLCINVSILTVPLHVLYKPQFYHTSALFSFPVNNLFLLVFVKGCDNCFLRINLLTCVHVQPYLLPY